MWVSLVAVLVATFGGTVALRFLKYETQLLLGCLMERLKMCHLLYIRSRRPKRIILMRHAESEGNVDKRIYTSTPDHALKITDRGQQQAAEAGLKLKELIGEESVYFIVSPYTRTRMTYEIAKDTLDPTEWGSKEDPRLRELDFGNFQDYESMQETMEVRKAYGRFWYRFMNGESGADVYDRATAFWESMFRSMDNTYSDKRYENYVIVTHGLMMRLILMRYFQWKVEFFESVWNPDNCGMWIMERNDRGGFRLVTDIFGSPEMSAKRKKADAEGPRALGDELSEGITGEQPPILSGISSSGASMEKLSSAVALVGDLEAISE